MGSRSGTDHLSDDQMCACGSLECSCTDSAGGAPSCLPLKQPLSAPDLKASSLLHAL